MEETRSYNNLLLDISMESGLKPLFLSSVYQTSIINNETKQNTRVTKPREKRKMTSILLQQQNTRTDVKINNSNNNTLDHIDENSNDAAISPKTTDLLSVNTEESDSAESTNEKDTLQSSLKENIKRTFAVNKRRRRRRKRRGKEASNSSQKNHARINIITDNLVDEACALQSANKKNTENVSVSPKTTDLSSTNSMEHNNTEDTTDKGNLTSPNTSNKDQKDFNTEKSRNKKASNSRKNNSRIGNSDDTAHSLQIVNNFNNITPKTADLSKIPVVKRKSTKEINDISILQSSRCTFYDIDYEFYEVNHAIIETFALNIYFFLCADEKKTYCLVCEKTFCIQSNCNLQNYFYKHIKSDEHSTLLCDMIKDHKSFVRNGKFFSKLALARECMRSKDNIVECLLCDGKKSISKIDNNDELLHEHIASYMHQNFKISWTSSIKTVLRDIHNRFRSRYNAKKYRCEFCNYETTSEMNFVKHLGVAYHTTRLTEIPDRMEKFKFHFCAACLLLWFGNPETYDYHNEQIEHKHRILYSSELDHLSEEIVQLLIFSDQMAETLFEQSENVYLNYGKAINFVLYNLVADLQKNLPSIKAYPFGSRISDLAFFDSDLDIFLDCGNMYDGRNSSHSRCQSLITLISYYLSHNKGSWKVQEIILQSRTPIVKVLHIPSRLICDISVTNGLAVENTKLIKCFNKVFPLCRKLILFLKRWLRLCDLLGSHFITSYALTWCVIFYLQTLQVFPGISQLIKLGNSSWQISGWKVGVSYDIPIRRINYNFIELLLGFFIFYGDFQYKSYVICPLLGRLIEKSAFSNLSNLPKEMTPYVAYMRNTCAQEKPQAFFLSPLCVQDPFDLSHNITKAMQNRKLTKLQTNCIYSAKVLKKVFPYLKSPLLS